MQVLLSEYKNQLTSSANGWEAYLFPGLGGGFSFYMEFDEYGRVDMTCDINESYASGFAESSYQLKVLQRPSLIFDTYSYIHLLSDPSPDTIGGVLGNGFYSDFEFGFVKSSEDTIMLKGTKNNSELILVRATPQKSQAYRSGYLSEIMASLSDHLLDYQFLSLPGPGVQKVNLVINRAGKQASLITSNGTTFKSEASAFAFTSSGLFLQQPLHYYEQEIGEFRFDPQAEKLYAITTESEIEVVISDQPIVPLHVLLGESLMTISVPPEPGSITWSSEFAGAWNFMAVNFYYCCELSTGSMDFTFNSERATMDLNIYVSDPLTSITYVLRYHFLYTKTSGGVYDFTPSGQPNGNGIYFEELIRPILIKLKEDRFVIGYIDNAGTYYGQMKSFEFPDDFFFSGIVK
jgi:hypothetical protein